MNPLLQLILQTAPDIIAEIQRRHAAANPGVPVPTADEIVAAFEEAFNSTVLKDELIKAANR
jgi:hypothetical protein